MISSATQYQKAREEVDRLTRWLARLENKEEAQRKGLTAASIHRMLSRIHQEIAEYEGASVSTPPRSKNGPEPDDAGSERSTTAPE